MSEATVSRLVRHLEGLSMLMRYFVYVLPETVYMHVSTQPKYQFKKKKKCNTNNPQGWSARMPNVFTCCHNGLVYFIHHGTSY